MAKVRTTLTIDEEVLKWVKIRAARTGASDSAVMHYETSALCQVWLYEVERSYPLPARCGDQFGNFKWQAEDSSSQLRCAPELAPLA